MKITRRNFFRNAGFAAMSSVVLLQTQNVFGQTQSTDHFFPIPTESTNDAFNYLRREHFAAVVNTVFHFKSEEGRTFNLQLLAADDLTRGTNQKNGFSGESYSLLFEGAKKSNVAQGEYLVMHETLGSFRVFIVPIGLRKNRYEAIINRINIPA